jgi:hypothetical protein
LSIMFSVLYVLFCLSSSCVWCAQCCQCLWIFYYVFIIGCFSNVYLLIITLFKKSTTILTVPMNFMNFAFFNS